LSRSAFSTVLAKYPIPRRQPGRKSFAASHAAKLLIKDGALDDPTVRENLLARLARHDMATDALNCARNSPIATSGAFNDVDICLDPFPQTAAPAHGKRCE